MNGEKREHLRLPVSTRIFIELVSPSMCNNDSGKIASCKTLDVSRGGLQVSLEHELTVGAILQIGVQMPETEEALYLAGEVEWCKPGTNSQKGWCAGFKIMNANNSDIERWQSLLTDMDG
jgi:Tfp pilus assembly protein PilZ